MANAAPGSFMAMARGSERKNKITLATPPSAIKRYFDAFTVFIASASLFKAVSEEIRREVAKGIPEITRVKNTEYTEDAVLKIAIPSSFNMYVIGILKSAPKIFAITFEIARMRVPFIKFLCSFKIIASHLDFFLVIIVYL